MDDVYDGTPGELAASDLADSKGAQWHDFGVLADITVATSSMVSEVLVLIILQDQLLLSAWVRKDF